MNQLSRLWRHLGGRRRRQFVLLAALMVISALAEVVSLGAVLPFLGILTAPELVFGHPVVARIAAAWGLTSADQLVLPLTIAFVSAALASGAIRSLLLWASTRLAFGVGSELSIDMYRRTLYQPFSVHVARNSSEVISGITIKVQRVIYDVLNPTVILFGASVLLLATMTALIAINPVVALVTALGFGVSYAMIARISRGQLNENSQRQSDEETRVVKALQEGLGGIRDVLLDGNQTVYCDIYRAADQPLRMAQAKIAFISQWPRYTMETFGMTLIAALAYGLSQQAGGLTPHLPVLGALALGAQRMLPALQHSYGAWANITGSQASLAATLDFLDQPLPQDMFQPAPKPFDFARTVRFNEVRFRYTRDGPWVLDRVNFEIAKGARIGIVGATGSGKSTLADVLMGLLEQSEGQLLIDDQPVSGSQLRAWQRVIAHVPQNIYLADVTLAENIAFGVPKENIDHFRVRQAAQQAQIAEFIESRPEGYNAHVGERGIRLSGGQRQRIGIARALYKQASVLVFDEATSALDNATEQSVMDAIEGLNRDLTILMIAHRLTTVRRCDTVVQLEHGRVVAQGTYEYLVGHSPAFRRMARATE